MNAHSKTAAPRDLGLWVTFPLSHERVPVGETVTIYTAVNWLNGGQGPPLFRQQRKITGVQLVCPVANLL